MNKETIKWGTGGAIGALLVELTLIIVQESQPYGSPPRESVHGVVFGSVAPVVWGWESLGVRGEEGLRFIVPVFASIFLYLAGIGFAVTAGLRRLWKLI